MADTDAELAAKLSKDAPVRSGYTTRAKEDTRAKKKAAAFTRPVRRWEKGPAVLGHISVPKWRVSTKQPGAFGASPSPFDEAAQSRDASRAGSRLAKRDELEGATGDAPNAKRARLSGEGT